MTACAGKNLVISCKTTIRGLSYSNGTIGSSDLVSYALKFWDAENTVVTLIYGLTFAVYVVISQSPDVRRMIKEYYAPLRFFAYSGNMLIVVLLVRLWWLESSILE